MSFPCVLCGAPIPEDAEGCPQCTQASDSDSPHENVGLPAPSLPTAPTSAPFSPEPGAPDFSVAAVATPPAPDVIKLAPEEPAVDDVLDVIELDAFQLDAIEIPPPPPPPAPRVAQAETFAPLPSLTEALKPRIEPVEPVFEPIVIEPEPVVAAEPPPRAEPTPIPQPSVFSRPVQVEAVRPSPPPVPSPASPIIPAMPATAPDLAVAMPRPQPRTSPLPAWPVREEEEEELGPQPEDVVDEHELRRRQTIRQLIIAAVILVLALATFAYLMRAQPWKKKPAPPVSTQILPATPAPTLSAPPAIESAPAPLVEVAPEEVAPEEEAPAPVAPKTKAPHSSAKPAVRPEPKPARKSSEEDAYMRQIRRQLQQR